MSHVAIAGLPGTDEVEWMDMRIEERGQVTVLLDAGRDPEIRVTTRQVEAQGKDLSGLRALFVRDLGIVPPAVTGADGRLDPRESVAALARSRRHLAAWNTLLEVLAARGTRVVNPPATHELHALKPWEVAAHAAAGAPVPASLATTGADDLLRPPPSRAGGWIEKGLVGGRTYTEPFVPGRPGPACARMVQERIEGVNVRAFVVGMRVIGAAAIHTLDGAETDSRRGGTRIRKIVLPPDAQRTAVEATRSSGMLFSAVDFMLEEATRRFVVLEVNSSPFFVAFETMTGIPVTSALADFLCDRGPRFVPRPEPAAARGASPAGAEAPA